ncbi:MAG: acyl-CoA dehydrogenase family protein, partial [Gammaproteobacteria bacterium]
MDFDLQDEQKMLQAAVRRFVREQYTPAERRRIAATAAGFSDGHWAQFAELGWLGVALPEAAGGLGCSFVETALVAAELGAGLVLEPYVVNAVLCATLLERAPATAGILADLAAGRTRLALAHDEPGRRFGLEAVDARALRTGGGWTLNGTKTLVLHGSIAVRLIVSAR